MVGLSEELKDFISIKYVISTYVRVYMSTYVRMCVHTYIQYMYVCTIHVPTNVHVSVFVFVNSVRCNNVYTYVCIRMCVCDFYVYTYGRRQ